MKLLVRLAFGIMLLFLYLLSLIAIELAGEARWHEFNPTKNLSCAISPENKNDHNDYGISVGWLAIPSICCLCGINWILTAAVEFVCAQCPYSMKGLMFGIGYFSIGFSVGVFYYFSSLFHNQAFKSLGPLSCIFWFLLASAVVVLSFAVLFVIASCCYKKRQREDHLPNQQCYAESYYGKNLSSSLGSI